MTQDEFDESDLEYKYYKTLDVDKISNFLDVAVGVVDTDDISRDFEKAKNLFISEIKEMWSDRIKYND